MQLGRAFLAEGFLYVISLLFHLTEKIIWSVFLHINKQDRYSLAPLRNLNSLFIYIHIFCWSKKNCCVNFFLWETIKIWSKYKSLVRTENNCLSRTILARIKKNSSVFKNLVTVWNNFLHQKIKCRCEMLLMLNMNN